LLKRAFTILGVTVALAGVGQAAEALTWSSKANPLTVYSGGYARGQAYGNFYNDNGQFARNASHYRDALPGGHGVYVETAYYWYKNTTCGSSWCTGFVHTKIEQTLRTTDQDWIDGYSIQDLDAEATSARAKIKVCEDRSWAPDACSSSVTRTFDY
jgi:hypothetical protein